MSTHAAIIAKVEQLVPIQGADRVQVAIVLGEFCVVGKDVSVGDIGVLFPADLQLSDEFCKNNNLYRNSEKNNDITKRGFFEDSRRVRAQVFLKSRSTAFFTSLNSLAYTNKPVFNVGERFNDIVVGGKKFPICERYISEAVKNKRASIVNGVKSKKKLAPLFTEHKDTQQLRHFIEQIPKGALLSFHAKAHGTSFRVGNVPVEQELPLWKKLINKVAPIFDEQPYQPVVGSRRVIIDNPNKEGFHGSESYRFDIARDLEPFVTKGMVVYGEIIGFVNGRPIMPTHDVKALKEDSYLWRYGESMTYSYNCEEHQYKWFIYHITVTDPSGITHDFDQKKLERWCRERNFESVFEVHPQVVYNGDVEALKEIVEELTERPSVLTEDFRDPSHISEGIILRVDFDGITTFYKNKSVPFKIMEGILTIDDVEELS